jgi:hypothetical protein
MNPITYLFEKTGCSCAAEEELKRCSSRHCGCVKHCFPCTSKCHPKFDSCQNK